MEMSTFRLPKDTYESIEELAKEGFKSKEELMEEVLHSFALAKMWEYKNEMKEFEQKYGMSFNDFKRKVEKTREENFEEWDDLIIWEGLYEGYKLWEKKVQRYKKCSKHYSQQRGVE
jgi:hypothetical protein